MRIFYLIIILALTVYSCTERKSTTDEPVEARSKVTFIELGSVRCIPCQKMQPIMESLEKRYGEQIEIVFYDVWTPEGKPKATEYKIRAIPTQIFLDKNGKEFHRHEGFYPESEIDKILKEKGLNPKNK